MCHGWGLTCERPAPPHAPAAPWGGLGGRGSRWHAFCAQTGAKRFHARNLGRDEFVTYFFSDLKVETTTPSPLPHALISLPTHPPTHPPGRHRGLGTGVERRGETQLARDGSASRRRPSALHLLVLGFVDAAALQRVPGEFPQTNNLT